MVLRLVFGFSVVFQVHQQGCSQANLSHGECKMATHGHVPAIICDSWISLALQGSLWGQQTKNLPTVRKDTEQGGALESLCRVELMTGQVNVPDLCPGGGWGGSKDTLSVAAQPRDNQTHGGQVKR